MENKYMEKYQLWCEKVTDDDVKADLFDMADNKIAIEDAFYGDLSFGTAGLRGIIGAGTNRMNVYTVAKASQGLADYLIKNFDEPSVVIGYDSRIKSDVFSKVTAGVFAANGVRVHIWPQLMPVPAVSYAIRSLRTSAGVMVTASHNPSKYNGYKVYGADGCQITTDASNNILAEIEKLDIFNDVKACDFDEGLASGIITYIAEEVYTKYVRQVKKQSVLFGEIINKNAAIVYSPLNGAGLEPVTRILRETGFINVHVVKEQELPDGNFPTCPYPNPENSEAMELGIEYARRCNADLFLATDPDCDRVGIAVKYDDYVYVQLTGNQTGLLLLDYICSQRINNGKMPKNPVMIKTIVSTDLSQKIASSYGVTTKNVLTGFKYIGEQIGQLEAKRKARSFIFGFEESYGYLTGSYVRDKDAVNAALLICEMFCYYASRGISLLERLEEIYEEHGYCLETVHSYAFEGAAGFEKMQSIMDSFRQVTRSLGKYKIVSMLDYSTGIDGLPKSDMLKFQLKGGHTVIVRPSGTEPKIKIYITVYGEDRGMAEVETEKIRKELDMLLMD